jgi:ATP-dependent helicase/nuclease subunit A
MSISVNKVDKLHTGPQITAANPGLSVWVSANAGTGKTRVLIDRIARLLLMGTKPERILCLTFTKAAAAEMANRLSMRLGDWSVMSEKELAEDLFKLTGKKAIEETISRARELFAETLDAPGGLMIRTIHSFCESLLGRFPLEAGIAPHFSVIDERTAGEMLAAAHNRLLTDALGDPEGGVSRDLNHIAGLINEDDFQNLMRGLDANRGRLKKLLARHDGGEGLHRAGRAALGLAEKDTHKSVIKAACEDADGQALKAASDALRQGTKADGERAAKIHAWLKAGQKERAESFLDLYAPIFLTKEGVPRNERNIITKKVREASPVALDALMAEQERLLGIMEKLKAVTVADASRALIGVGAAILEHFEAAKKSLALLDYDDLIFKARGLLAADGGASWVHYKLDGGIDHILVDEAQDTSFEQWRVIAALADDFFAGAGARDDKGVTPTIFAVGDEKQSIYSFQGADPVEFSRMRDYFAAKVMAAEKDWRPVGLEASWRSTLTVLKAVDAVFAGEDARRGLTHDAAPVRHLTTREGQAGIVEIWPTCKAESAPETDPWDAPLDRLSAISPPARLAAMIAGKIKLWLDTGELLASAARPVKPGDILILVRRRQAFAEEMVRQLKRLAIPVAGSDRMVLTEQLAVMDLMAMGRFVLFPEDDLNLAVVLKSPLIGLSEEELFLLAFGRKGGLWQELKRRSSDAKAFAKAYDYLSAARAKADFAPPFEFFSRILSDGGRRRLVARLGPDANDPIDEFLGLALDFERDHAASLQGFLHWLEAGRTEIKRDLEQGRGEVRVMTVHGAKGLQSNIVFLPDTCAVPMTGRDARLLWDDEEGTATPALFWPVVKKNRTAHLEDLAEKLAGAAGAEYKRLLYVALTRARDRLYICGFENKLGRAQGCWYDHIRNALVSEGGEAEEIILDDGDTGWRITGKQEAAPDGAKDTAPGEDETGPLPPWAHAPPPREPEPARPLVPSRPAEIEPAIISPLITNGDSKMDEGGHFKRGRIIHQLLQTLPDLAPDRRGGAAESYLARPVLGLDGAAQKGIAAEVLGILNHADFAALFAPGSQAEVPLSGLVRGHAVSGRIDRILISADAVTIVDFKTNRPPPEKVADVAAIYLRQMAAYRALLRIIFPGRAVRCLLLWTAGPDLMALPDDLMDPYFLDDADQVS